MKRFLSVILTVVIAVSGVVALSGCSKANEAKFDIVFITDGQAVNDKAYNQMAWNGVKNFGDENNMSYRYYQPSLNDKDELETDVVENYIKLSVDCGAKYIVLQGEKMAVATNELASKYADINFLLVDAYPHTKDSAEMNIIENVMTVSFDTLQAGFLAGYTAVTMENTKLGYFGSVSDESSSSYGTGYVNGAAYAADEKGIPVVMDYANYDASNLNYDYSFTIRPVYQKVEDAKEETFKVTVVNGQGSGVYTDGENVTIKANPSSDGKVFDHWDVKSETDGVKNKKVNISSNKKSEMNLLVGDCDCTITAVYKDAQTVAVKIVDTDNNVLDTVYTEKDSKTWIQAPVAKSGMVFDHWEAAEKVVDKEKESGTDVSVGSEDVTVKAIYVKSENPTFDVIVENGTGSGSYVSGDNISIVANASADGYMFYKWENIDNQGLSTGIAMKNEYCYNTEFEMVDRYASIPEAMFDAGTQVIFGGGNSQSISIYTASWSISHQVYAFGYGRDENDLGNCLASVVTDYRVAVLNALKEYKGGTNYVGDCSNNCLYVTNIAANPTYTDDKGNEVTDEKYNENFGKIYNSLADGSLKLEQEIAPTSCLTVNYWVK